MMKRVFAFIFLTLFLVNTSLVSAWAEPCMHDMGTSSLVSNMLPSDGSDPCHQTEDSRQSYQQHCEGLCFCAYMASGSTLFIHPSESFDLSIIANQTFLIDNDTLASVSQIPPRRPPKHIS